MLREMNEAVRTKAEAESDFRIAECSARAHLVDLSPIPRGCAAGRAAVRGSKVIAPSLAFTANSTPVAQHLGLASAGLSSAPTQGAALGGAKCKPEDATPRARASQQSRSDCSAQRASGDAFKCVRHRKRWARAFETASLSRRPIGLVWLSPPESMVARSYSPSLSSDYSDRGPDRVTRRGVYEAERASSRNLILLGRERSRTSDEAEELV